MCIFAQLLIDYRGIIEYSLSNRHGLVLLRPCFNLQKLIIINDIKKNLVEKDEWLTVETMKKLKLDQFLL